MDKSLNKFKVWFAIHYPESKDYLGITSFDYDKKLFVANDTWNPDSVIAAKVLRMTFKAWQHQQAKVEELETQLSLQRQRVKAFEGELTSSRNYGDELQKRVDYLERQLSIKTRHCEFFEKSRIGHRSLAIMRKLQIEKALKQIEALYTKAEKDYEQDRNPYYDGMLSALDLAEQAIRGELEEQALKGEA